MKSASLLVSLLCILREKQAHSFLASTRKNVNSITSSSYKYSRPNANDTELSASSSSSNGESESRRSVLNRAASSLPLIGLTTVIVTANPPPSHATKAGAEDASDKYAPKFVQTYEDFVQEAEGWQYKDVKVGSGELALEPGDRAVFDWSGYTIGYFGRPFEAKGGPQGGAFDKDLDFSRTVIGSGSMVPGVEKALMSMKPGGVRQVIVPYGELSYPSDDLEHNRVGPKPTTFSGQRALNFVLENPRVDRTLLFNIKLVRIDKANGKGGFTRG